MFGSQDDLLTGVRIPGRSVDRCTDPRTICWQVFESQDDLLTGVRIPGLSVDRCSDPRTICWQVFGSKDDLLTSVRIPGRSVDKCSDPWQAALAGFSRWRNSSQYAQCLSKPHAKNNDELFKLIKQIWERYALLHLDHKVYIYFLLLLDHFKELEHYGFTFPILPPSSISSLVAWDGAIFITRSLSQL